MLSVFALFFLILCSVASVGAQVGPDIVERGDSVSMRFIDADLGSTVRAISRFMDRPVIYVALPAARVTIETGAPIPRRELAGLLSSVLRAHGLRLEQDSAAFRIDFSPVVADVPASVDQSVRMIGLTHASASEVAATINALYGRPSAVGELGASFPDEESRSGTPPRVLGGTQDQSGGATFSGSVAIVPDERSNSLLVRASAADFDLVATAVQQLDVRPLQVVIEVLIAEVRRDRSLDWGMELLAPPAEGETGPSETVGVGLGGFALRVLRLSGQAFSANLVAAARRGDVSIVSRPVLLAANNETASILVGSQRPFIQVSRSLPTDTPTRDQVVQYRDVGTQLIVTPTISADGYVMMTVAQEVNAATSETAFDAPVISTRSVQTRLLVRDGQTAVIGGLMDQQEDQIHSGVPVLSGIPFLGGLFGGMSTRKSETELFIFITPSIIASDADIDELSTAFREKANGGGP